MPLTFGKRCRFLVCVLLFVSMTGCLSVEVKDEALPESYIALTISAHPLTNLDLSGRPSPTVVRVYQLRKEVDFNEASFFDLYDQDKMLLAADLLSREELIIAPGTVVNRQLLVDAEARFVAIMAAFQDTNNSVHKQIQPVRSDADTVLVAHLSGNSLVVTSDETSVAQGASVATSIDTQSSQGISAKDGEVSVNPMKLEECQRAKAVDVLVKKGC
ncbi:MAG: type VI secretion system lipoprotein TssJ [Amphritea sp.]|nr:type VI secretion system lipoprotein TssJ [Amphritea sp.]